MTFEVGKTYKTCDGYKRTVLAVTSDGRLIVQAREESNYATLYNSDGTHPDLPVANLIPPRPTVVVSDAVLDAWVAVYNGGGPSRDRSAKAIVAAISDYLADPDNTTVLLTYLATREV